MDATTTGTGHEKAQEDLVANSESMLMEFMRGKTLPASYKEWKVCHHCRKREPVGQPFRQCGHCKTMGVEHIILYCSRECQRGDWPAHKKICGNQEGSYDLKKDTGYVFLKPGSNKKGRLLLEWNHVYRRMLIWAVRQAFASPGSFENSRIIIEFSALEARDQDGTWRDRIFPVAYLLRDFDSGEDDTPPVEGSRTIHMSVKDHKQGPAPIAICELCLFEEQMVVAVPMLPCDQDAYFAPYSNIAAGPCPQWAFMLHLLSLQGPRSSTILDSFLDGLLGCVIELENRTDHPMQKFAAPKLGLQPWSIYEHGVNSWMVSMAPYIFRWKAKFHPEMDEKTREKKLWSDALSALKVTMQEMVSRSR